MLLWSFLNLVLLTSILIALVETNTKLKTPCRVISLGHFMYKTSKSLALQILDFFSATDLWYVCSEKWLLRHKLLIVLRLKLARIFFTCSAVPISQFLMITVDWNIGYAACYFVTRIFIGRHWNICQLNYKNFIICLIILLVFFDHPNWIIDRILENNVRLFKLLHLFFKWKKEKYSYLLLSTNFLRSDRARSRQW